MNVAVCGHMPTANCWDSIRLLDKRGHVDAPALLMALTASQDEEQLNGERHECEHGTEGTEPLIWQVVNPFDQAIEHACSYGDQDKESQQKGAVVYQVVRAVRSHVPFSDNSAEEDKEQQSAEDEIGTAGLAPARRIRGSSPWRVRGRVDDRTAKEAYAEVDEWQAP